MNEQPASVDVLKYSAFTDRGSAGNPAGVVLDAEGLSDAVMQRIASQLNLAETAFLVAPASRDADVRLRWFTPTQEVTLCGHATIAVFAAAAQRGVYSLEEGETRTLRVETLSGVLRVRISHHAGVPRVAMQLPLPSFSELRLDRGHFADLWNVGVADLEGEWMTLEDLNYWYLPIRDLATLRRLSLNREGLARVDDTAAFAFFTRETVDPGSHWHLRFFAPFHGVAEDIVTGSAQGPMGALYLRQAVESTAQGWLELQGEQGDHLGRPGRVQVRVLQEGGKVQDLEISGRAVPILEGRVLL